MNDRYEALNASLGDVLDVEAGLRDVLLGTKYTAMTTELADVLDVDTGLFRVMVSANVDRPTARQSATPVAIEEVVGLIAWARETAELEAEERISLRARFDPERWIEVQLLSRLRVAALTVMSLSTSASAGRMARLAGEVVDLAAKSTRPNLVVPAMQLRTVLTNPLTHGRPVRLAARKLEQVVIDVRREAMELLWGSCARVERNLLMAMDAVVNATSLSLRIDESFERNLVVAIDHVLDAIGDFTGADLRTADLTNVSLTGLRWSATTRWPPGWGDIRLMSDEVEPGVYVIRGGTSNAFT